MWKFARAQARMLSVEMKSITVSIGSHPTFAALSAKFVSVLPIIERDEFVGQCVGHEGLVLFGGHVAVDCVNWSWQRFLAMHSDKIAVTVSHMCHTSMSQSNS